MAGESVIEDVIRFYREWPHMKSSYDQKSPLVARAADCVARISSLVSADKDSQQAEDAIRAVLTEDIAAITKGWKESTIAQNPDILFAPECEPTAGWRLFVKSTTTSFPAAETAIMRQLLSKCGMHGNVYCHNIWRAAFVLGEPFHEEFGPSYIWIKRDLVDLVEHRLGFQLQDSQAPAAAI